MKRRSSLVLKFVSGVTILIVLFVGLNLFFDTMEKDYRVLNRVRLTLNSAEGVKRRVVEFATKYRRWPVGNEDVGLPPASKGLPPGFSPDHVKAVAVSEGGVVTITFSEGPHWCASCSNIKNTSLILTPHLRDGSVSWTCTSQNMPTSYLPRESGKRLCTRGKA